MLSSAPYLFTELYDIFSKVCLLVTIISHRRVKKNKTFFIIIMICIAQAPVYTQFLEVALVILVIWLIFHKANFGGKKLSTEVGTLFCLLCLNLH